MGISGSHQCEVSYIKHSSQNSETYAYWVYIEFGFTRRPVIPIIVYQAYLGHVMQ